MKGLHMSVRRLRARGIMGLLLLGIAWQARANPPFIFVEETLEERNARIIRNNEIDARFVNLMAAAHAAELESELIEVFKERFLLLAGDFQAMARFRSEINTMAGALERQKVIFPYDNAVPDFSNEEIKEKFQLLQQRVEDARVIHPFLRREKIQLLKAMGFENPEEILNRYPEIDRASISANLAPKIALLKGGFELSYTDIVQDPTLLIVEFNDLKRLLSYFKGIEFKKLKKLSLAQRLALAKMSPEDLIAKAKHALPEKLMPDSPTDERKGPHVNLRKAFQDPIFLNALFEPKEEPVDFKTPAAEGASEATDTSEQCRALFGAPGR